MADIEHASAIMARTATGAGWIVGWRMAKRGLGFVSTLALAHLLVPADFGLVSLGWGLALSLDAFSAIGVEEGLIRHGTLTRVLYNTAFTMNVLRGAATMTVLLAIAYPAGLFFSDMRLCTVIVALALGMFATSCSNIGIVDFRRDLAFDREFWLMVLPRIAGMAVTIAVAAEWRSYLALIAGILTGQLLTVVASYAMHPYRPGFTLAGWRDLVGFSVWTWLTSCIALVRDRADAFLIGRLLGVTSLGTFLVGVEIADLPNSELVGPLGRACFSGFAQARHSGHETAQIYLRVIALIALLTFPASLGISLVADPITRLALGPNWVAAVPVMRVFALFSGLTVFGVISGSLFSAHAMLRPIFRVVVFSALVRLVLLAALVWRFGLLGAVCAAGLGMCTEYTAYMVMAFRRFALRLPDLIRQIWRSVLGAAVMTAVLAGCGLGWTTSPADPADAARLLATAVSVGAAVYTATVVLAWLACGRPAGAEADLSAFLRSAPSRWRAA